MKDYMRDDYGPRFPRNEREQCERLEALIQSVYSDLLHYKANSNEDSLEKALSNIAEASSIIEAIR